GCGVTSEVATHHPSAIMVGTAHVAPVGDSEHLAQVPGRPGVARPAVAAAAPNSAAMPLTALATRRPGTRPGAPLGTPRSESTTTVAPALAVGAPNRRIQSGRIIDEAGEPLVGATVLLKGTSRGASTDANGDYSLAVPLGNNTFVFAYTGYQEEVAQSPDGQPLTVTLLPIPGLLPAAPEPKNKIRTLKAHPRKTLKRGTSAGTSY
ncbi:MAG: carboxypeptidase-like regulatory domain-containing protein, partial [Janthinobacterium lividum]